MLAEHGHTGLTVTNHWPVHAENHSDEASLLTDFNGAALTIWN